MEALGLTASITQLAAYGHSAVQSLLRLYQAVRAGPAAYRDQQSNVSILFSIICRIYQRDLVGEESISPLLSDIAKLARKIQALLEQKGFLGLNWALIVRPESLSEAFVSLDEKRKLLHLHLSERNQDALSQIRTDTTQLMMSLAGPGRRREGERSYAGTGIAPANFTNAQNNAGSSMQYQTQMMSNPGAYIASSGGRISGSGRQNLGCGYNRPPTILNVNHTITGSGTANTGDRNPGNPQPRSS